jgi:hypothetical protein
VAVIIGLLILQNAWVAILGYHLGMVAVLVVVGSHFSIKTLFHSRNWYIPVITALVGACAGLALYLLWPFLSISADIDLYLHNIGLTTTTWPVFMAYFILVNPFLEEYYWRGFQGSPSKRVILEDVLFAGYHILVLFGKMEILWLIAIFLALTVGAWIWRQANRWGQGLLPSTISHLAADASVIFAIYFCAIHV